MTCSHCCGAEMIFDDKEASKMMRRYRKKGPRKTTRRLLGAISDLNVRDMTLLDIGGGVGAIQHELLATGLRSTTDVDASASYIRAAKEIGNERNTSDQMTFIHGDFVDVFPALDNHDVVTLEKVVCCYPYVEDLVKSSAGKSTNIYGLVYPIDSVISRFLTSLGNLYLRITRNPFRSFVHSEALINQLIEDDGFERVHYSTVFPWKVAVYQRK